MRRTFNQIKTDDYTTRNVVVIYDDPCEPGTLLYQDRQILFLRYLANDPRLASPGDTLFSRLIIEHNGVCWVATAVSFSTLPSDDK